MVYTEVKKKNGKSYYYRVLSFRKKKKVSKKRVYLGVDLKKSQLYKKEKQADKELMLLSTLLNEIEKKELQKIKNEYLKLSKKTKNNRYEAFVSLFTYDSTAIEGNTLTLQETSQLLFENITPRKSLREINEIVNHKKAFDFIIRNKKDISKSLILNLHKLIVHNTLKPELNDQIGIYRTLQVYIRGVEWIPPIPKNVSKEMASLFSWYSKNKKKLHPIILAAYFHSGFEAIHPFVDGNGRVGRLLMNLILLNHNYPMINIPNKKKHIYYRTLSDAQIKENLRPLVKFLFDLLKKNKVKF
jgi:cell filamentation protein, protein adenylyltransferase